MAAKCERSMQSSKARIKIDLDNQSCSFSRSASAEMPATRITLFLLLSPDKIVIADRGSFSKSAKNQRTPDWRAHPPEGR